jgi:hypothetical protein
LTTFCLLQQRTKATEPYAARSVLEGQSPTFDTDFVSLAHTLRAVDVGVDVWESMSPAERPDLKELPDYVTDVLPPDFFKADLEQASKDKMRDAKNASSGTSVFAINSVLIGKLAYGFGAVAIFVLAVVIATPILMTMHARVIPDR